MRQEGDSRERMRAVDPLTVALRRLARRLAVQQGVRFYVTALFYSLCAACFWLVMTRLFPVLGDALPVCIALFAVGMVGATVLAVVKRPTLVETALKADRRLGLRERLTSSLEMEEAEGEMVAALHADARRILSATNFKGHFPLVTNRAMRWVFAPLLSFGLVYAFLPEFDLLRHRERIAEAKAKEDEVDVHIERLREAARPLKEKGLDEGGAVADAMAQIEKVAEELKTGGITEKQALAKLTNLADELRKQRENMSLGNPKTKTPDEMDQLGMAKDLAAAMQQGKMGDAAMKARELQKKIARGQDERRGIEEAGREHEGAGEDDERRGFGNGRGAGEGPGRSGRGDGVGGP